MQARHISRYSATHTNKLLVVVSRCVASPGESSRKFQCLCVDSDAPEVDIVGTNLYQRYVDRMLATRNQIDNSSDQADQGTGKDADGQDAGLPSCRNVPPAAEFHRQTVNTVVPILVRTGVYRGPASDSKDRSSSVSSSEEEDEDGSVEDHTDQRDFQGHRDFPNNAELRKPQRICDDVASAIDYIMSREDWLNLNDCDCDIISNLCHIFQ